MLELRSLEAEVSGVLGAYRVLDLTSERGLLCGQVLADLGADVIQIEPPGGSSARKVGPFVGEKPEPEGSLFWWAYARGKRGLRLDLESDRGRDTLRKLVRGADFLIESEPPGVMVSRGLGYEDLAAINPSLIHVSITPFGSNGPKAHWLATDLTLLAAGGPLVLQGDEDRPPTRLASPQAWLHAAASAAVGALVAHEERAHSGRGQHVDVSAQQALTAATQADILADLVGDSPLTRIAGGALAGPVRLRFVYPARDGHVSITHVFGSAIGPAVRRLMQYVHDEGFCDAATRDKDWEAYGAALLSGQETLEDFERVKQCIAACTASKSKQELLHAALERGLLMAPITTIGDVCTSDQLQARDYLKPLDRGDGRSVVYPGAFAKFSAAPIRYTGGAPHLDEHGNAIRAELHDRPRRAATDPPDENADPSSRGQPLAGVKILDFMWALAGPGATRILADYGATVIRIESTKRICVCRTLQPFQNGVPDPERSAIFHSTNAGKRMLTLDPTKPEGREVVLDLVRWADVVSESFSPKGMAGFGLGYDTLRKHKPDLIMLSTCLMGQTGPLARFAGFGNLAAAVAGFYELAGWPDRDPAGPFGAYTDYIAPRYNAIAVLAALEHRRRTGEGQHIDLSQAEAALHFLAPALLDFGVNGKSASRMGNRDPDRAPHGVYPARGEERWIAIAVEDDAQWRMLARLLELDEPRFATREGRLAAQDELDAIVSAWTRERDVFDLERELQAAGIPASAVQSSPELVRDAALRHREHFVEIEHPHGGTAWIEASRFRLSHTPAQYRSLAPTFGLDNEWVLGEVLGYDDERIAELAIAGALE